MNEAKQNYTNQKKSPANFKQEAKSETTSLERLKELAAKSNELAQIVAANPATPSELLKELGSKRNQLIQKAVVSNPNTPTETLLTLGAKFSKQLLENPVFKLFFLENLNFAAKIPVDTLHNLLQHENIPQILLESAAKHDDLEIAEMAKFHVNLSGEMAEGWQEIAEKAIKNLAPSSKIYQDSEYS